MPRSRVVVALGLYGFAVVIAFALLWADDATDDYAGWAPATAVLALPAVLALLADPPRAGHRHVWTVAIPAGLALGSITIDVALRFIRLVHGKPAAFELLGFAIFGGLAVALGFAIVVWRYLMGRPLREGATKVLLLVALVGVGALLVAPLWGELWLLGGLALAWTLAPAIALTATPGATQTPPR